MPPPSTTAPLAAAEAPPARPTAAPLTRVLWRRRVAKLTRWLHVYGSMVSLAIVLFFAITGVTLNHQEWFDGQVVTVQRHGTIDPAWLGSGGAGVDELRVVEYLRATAGASGAVSEFRVDDSQCEVVFKGPGYAASAVIDRATGRFDFEASRLGLAAVVNDLHKGRDSGPVWRALIDASAGLLVAVSLTGLVLLYFLHKHRLAGVILLGAGGLCSYLVYLVWVP